MDQNANNQNNVGPGGVFSLHDREAEKTNMPGENADGKIPAVRTFKFDAAEYVKKKNVSYADIVMAGESAKKTGLSGNGESVVLKRAIALILFLALIAAGAAGFMWYKRKTATPVQAVFILPKSILTAEEQTRIDVVDKAIFLSDLAEAMSKPLRLNYLLDFPLVRKTEALTRMINSKEFLMMSGIVPPSYLSETLGDRFMVAKFYSGKEAPLLILTINAYDRAFIGMLDWEKNMAKDLIQIFSGLARQSPVIAGFKDTVIQGRDVRILNNRDGEVMLAYSFVSQKYLVITTDIAALKEIFRRFSLSQYLNE